MCVQYHVIMQRPHFYPSIVPQYCLTCLLPSFMSLSSFSTLPLPSLLPPLLLLLLLPLFLLLRLFSLPSFLFPSFPSSSLPSNSSPPPPSPFPSLSLSPPPALLLNNIVSLITAAHIAWVRQGSLTCPD